MHKTSFRSALRATAFVATMLSTGGAIAAQNTGGGPDPRADCLQKAYLQYTADDAFCFNYPAYTELHAQCRQQAAIAYARATAACASAFELGKISRKPFGVSPRTTTIGSLG